MNIFVYCFFRKCEKVYHPCVGKNDTLFDNVKFWFCGEFVKFIVIIYFFSIKSDKQPHIQ